ncbi:MAG TPA: MFS transporter, partial [Steroidobacteraceae bacterium]|nr:MFS transporter [Steroidobacteraceae bacterium]
MLLLFGGYAALYFCRADLSVAAPLLVEDLAQHGIPHDRAIVQLGTMSSLGVLAYALGKPLLGGLGDFWGGRRNFLIGLAGATLFTVTFAVTGALPVLTIAWIGNRLTQSGAWAGLIKISSRWFDYSSHGTIVGILSVSYLAGDAVAREAMGVLIEHGAGWRSVFYFAGAVAGALLLANLLFLRESRARLGYPEAKVNPRNVFGEADSRPPGLSRLLLPLLRNRGFLLVCLLSFGTTIVRETFNTWTPLYLRDEMGYTAGSAASLSAVFPAAGVLSILLAGWLSDRLGPQGRSLLLFVGLAASA